MPRPERGFQGRRARSARAPPSGPVGWEDVEQWERAADAGPDATANGGDLRCTPWRHREELLAVRDLLYARDEEGEEGAVRAAKKRRLGVGTVELWRRRAPRLLPRAVLATAQLVDAVELRSAVRRARARERGADDVDSHGAGGIEETVLASPFAVRAVYEAAVAGLVVAFCDTRATAGDGGEAFSDFVLEEVNGDPEGTDGSDDGGDEDEFSDEDDEDDEDGVDEHPADEDAPTGSRPRSPAAPPKRKATAHGSMYAAARAVGMPAAWVELRHEIAHGAGPEAITEPSLKRLHACAEEALEWLWARYWQGLDEPPSAALARSEDQTPRDLDDSERSELLKALLRARKVDMRQGSDVEGDKAVRAIIEWHDAPNRHVQVAKLAKAFVKSRRLLPRTDDIEKLDMNVAFAIWDAPLHRLCLACAGLYQELAKELLISLYEMPEAAQAIFANGPADDSDNDYDGVETQATTQWLRRMVHSDEWKCVRSAHFLRECGLDTALLWDLMDECITHPLPSTLRFAEYLYDRGDQDFRNHWRRFYKAARSPKWKWRRQGRDPDPEESDDDEQESKAQPSESADGQRPKRPLEVDVDDDYEGGRKAEDGTGDAAKHRKVESVQTTGWARAPIGEVPVRRTVTVSDCDNGGEV